MTKIYKMTPNVDAEITAIELRDHLKSIAKNHKEDCRSIFSKRWWASIFGHRKHEIHFPEGEYRFKYPTWIDVSVSYANRTSR